MTRLKEVCQCLGCNTPLTKHSNAMTFTHEEGEATVRYRLCLHCAAKLADEKDPSYEAFAKRLNDAFANLPRRLNNWKRW